MGDGDKVPVRNPIILWFQELGKGDVPRAGGKGANLGELTHAGIPVPPGFVVAADAYHQFLTESNLAQTIRDLLSGLNPNDNEKLQIQATRIKDAILRESMPRDIETAICEAYRTMGAPTVAVRSSATAEDLAEASFAGQQSTFLNIQGEDAVLDAVKGCWASLFEPRAIFYRAHQGFDHVAVKIAVPVQRMVQSEISGVLFTAEPVSNDRNKIVIEAIFGLGEAIVSGAVTPDLYILDKRTLQIVEKTVARQTYQLVRNPQTTNRDNTNMELAIPAEQQGVQKLDDATILELAKLGRRIEEHYGTPQDIEWAGEGGRIYIVQSRPITTLQARPELPGPARGEGGPQGRPREVNARLLISGSPASPGANFGPVKVIFSASQIGEVQPGDVLVAPMTTPDFVPAMERASAIVTDQGGRTCHAAIVSRELGIPCVVGTGNATRSLRDRQIITVDGTTGKVWEGAIMELMSVETRKAKRRIKTATKLYVNLAAPKLAEQVAQRYVDGVGLLRAEFIINDHIREHPRYLIETGRSEEFITKLAEGLTTFARSFAPRPVVYRTTDFKTNEYRNLRGGEKYEGEEENPMLGYRGASRYTKDVEVFKLEIEAIKRVRRTYKNLWVMIPFVRTVEELANTKRLLSKYGLRRSESFKLWMMAEIPSNVFLLDQFLDVGIDGVSIGSNDLTQLILGVDRDNQKLVDVFDERNPAVMMALEHIIRTCKRRGVTVSICGQAPSVYPELTQKLVEWGVTSVSVSPDMIDETRRIIARAERRLQRAKAEAAAAPERNGNGASGFELALSHSSVSGAR
ncbi:MAG: phosphoenolpyruvate synthase [Chloroflexi bacterium]|nr:phosphoenolpyruvate synthase [Chloroflexota bacterium]